MPKKCYDPSHPRVAGEEYCRICKRSEEE